MSGVGNPALRRLSAKIFTNHFGNGDGLLCIRDERGEEEPEGSTDVAIKMFRRLLTESGHYLLPTDHQDTTQVSFQTEEEISLYCQKVYL